MSLDEESLETAANGGLMDLDKWPSMVEPLLERLEYIIYNAFPMPEVQPEPPSTLEFQSQYLNPTTSFIHDPNFVPSSSNKENAAPPDLQTPPRPTPSSLIPPSSIERVPDSLPASQAGVSSSVLPAPLLLLLRSIQSTMRSFFNSKPPHTIQRLAELILQPNKHYRTLPAYLRAVDRVVLVTSSADLFPLPLQSSAATAQPNGTINGSDHAFMLADNTFGSDESLGGALLTPIPWLTNPSSPGPEAAAMDEATTAPTSTLQHQLLTQSADPSQSQQQIVISNPDIENALEGEMTDNTEEVPHARGPSLLGVEDLGLQDGKGVEMTLLSTEGATEGQSSEAESAAQDSAPEAATGNPESTTAATALATNDDADGDGDITLSDEPTIPHGDEKH
ncbi:hypothetical protein BJX99DRAFT_227994 [Aspergillus californicus]